MGDVVVETNMLFIDTSELVRDAFPDDVAKQYQVLPFDAHPGPEFNALYAEIIWQNLRPLVLAEMVEKDIAP